MDLGVFGCFFFFHTAIQVLRCRCSCSFVFCKECCWLTSMYHWAGALLFMNIQDYWFAEYCREHATHAAPYSLYHHCTSYSCFTHRTKKTSAAACAQELTFFFFSFTFCTPDLPFISTSHTFLQSSKNKEEARLVPNAIPSMQSYTEKEKNCWWLLEKSVICGLPGRSVQRKESSNKKG